MHTERKWNGWHERVQRRLNGTEWNGSVTVFLTPIHQTQFSEKIRYGGFPQIQSHVCILCDDSIIMQKFYKWYIIFIGKNIPIYDTVTICSCIWPCIIGVPFPRNFITIAKTILKRLFRVYAHIYHAHFDDVITLQEEAHLNTSFKHFIYFVHEFNLIEKRELSPMAELIDRMMKQ